MASCYIKRDPRPLLLDLNPFFSSRDPLTSRPQHTLTYNICLKRTLSTTSLNLKIFALTSTMEPSAPSSRSEPPGSPKSTKYALSSTDVEQEPVACIFCLNDLLRGTPSAGVDEDVARLNPCNHTMHNECLQLWLGRANSCPLCRTNFNEVSVSKTLDSESPKSPMFDRSKFC